MRTLFDNAHRGKRVLVTGHTGFKGSWLCIWLLELGAEVVGYGLEPYSMRDNFVVTKLDRKMRSIAGDIRDYDKLQRVFHECKPETVFHLAAQPLVRLSYDQPKMTYDTNVGGTVNVFECCRHFDSVRVILNVTSDKCYRNNEWLWGYRENDPLGGDDPYSSSKACSELVTSAYRDCFFGPGKCGGQPKRISSVRAGNVIGGGDWRQDRIVPDCIRALERGEPIGVRSPTSVRPWQHVLEPLRGYLLLASKMYGEGETYSGAWNFGPDHRLAITVEELVRRLVRRWGNGKYTCVSSQLSGESQEAQQLCLDTSKSARLLNWTPVLDIDEAIDYTVQWYQEPSVDYEFCVTQIADYVAKATASRGGDPNHG